MNTQIASALTVVGKCKKIITLGLIGLMLIIVMASVVELGIMLVMELFDPTKGMIFLEIEEIFELFGFFFLILIGVELVETMVLYFKEGIIHAEIILLIAVIAVSRKVILLDLKAYDPIVIVGLAALICSLGICYWLIKKSH